MLANCRNFRDALHNSGAFQCKMRVSLPELQGNLPINHDVVQNTLMRHSRMECTAFDQFTSQADCNRYNAGYPLRG
ncbi:hypothetical protein LMG28688_04257 [Paraburkholderia caffeinitolerans]|uniref:Uncharacterized protein n=1 Tax=Paraburkholderia caffeinitolerans TaxID=1723730 RepID=A0A6J5GBX3_9BURK|nr:hypothetical protein LMG28688_04257 [Paraburkholderia caffeinitolerans]